MSDEQPDKDAQPPVIVVPVETPEEEAPPPEMTEEERRAKERAYNAARPVTKTEAQESFTYRQDAYLGYGDGKKDCPECKGKGVVDLPADPASGYLVPATRKCICVLARDILANVERGWPGLTKAPKVDSSVLRGKEERSLWITCTTRALMAHLRHVALRMGPNWEFLVTSDADLMKAWLATDVAKAVEIFDADVASAPKYEFVGLDDLVVPPALLVILLGVKAARNKAMPEVLLETLRLRTYRNLPTWIVDQPDRQFQHGHLAYSDAVLAEIDGWGRAKVSVAGGGKMPEAKDLPKPGADPNDQTHDGPEEDATLDGVEPVGTGATVAALQAARKQADKGMARLLAKDENDSHQRSKPGKPHGKQGKPRRGA